ncbi:MAG: ABC transporter ATP-binding protein, partial [Nitrospinales bacterium]
MVVLENIDKSFGPKKVIQNLSLEVGEGEIFTLLGESGCGKTTLLRLVAGFLQPDGGRILIENEDMLSLPVERRPVGFIFQNHALFPHLSVYDNIAVGPRIRNVPEKETRKQIDALLEAARIQDLKQAYPNQISGGESQRVAIVRAVVNRPKVLLLDEPLSSLDPGLRQSLREELVEMQKTFGLTFFFVTHDQEEALSLSTRIGILESGRLLQVGPPAELYDRPKTPYIAQFLGEVNPLRGGVVRQSGSRVSIQIDGGGLIHCDSREP